MMEEGLNVYITCYIYDGKNVTDVIQTGIVRQSFAPTFNFKELLSLDISREFLLGSARAASEIVFEARHRPADAPAPTGMSLVAPVVSLCYRTRCLGCEPASS
jgi:hypothetical protein